MINQSPIDSRAKLTKKEHYFMVNYWKSIKLGVFNYKKR